MAGAHHSHLFIMLPSSHTAKMAHSHNEPHEPNFERTSLGTLDDARPAPGGQGPFMMSTLVPDQFPAAPANVQLTRTSITGVADEDDDDSGLEKGDDLEKGQVRRAWTPVHDHIFQLVIIAGSPTTAPFWPRARQHCRDLLATKRLATDVRCPRCRSKC